MLVTATTISAVHASGTSSLGCLSVHNLQVSLFLIKTYLETRSSRQATSELHECTANLVSNGRLALLVMNMARAAGEETTATRARSGSGSVMMLLSVAEHCDGFCFVLVEYCIKFIVEYCDE